MTKRTRKSTFETQLAAQRENISDLIEAAGSQKSLGEALGVSQAAISKWLLRGYLPLKRAAEVEAVYGVPRTKLADPRVVGLLTSPEFSLQPA
jgi:hypothetical protein